MLRDVSTNQLLYGLCAIAALVAVVRVFMNVKGPEDFETTVSAEQVQGFARAQLSELQAQSFAQDMEFCGIIFEDREGRLGTTPIVSGEQASCDIAYFDEPGMAPVASYHTHGGYSDEYDSEVPSMQDFDSDVATGLDGFIATPGGRFWRIDATEEVAIQLCGAGCLQQDTRYKPCDAETPREQYTRAELVQRRTNANGQC